MTESLEEKRQQALDAGKCFSKGRLRDEFRMKPKPGAEPVTEYENGYGKWFGVYRLDQCIPMKAASTKPRSKKQQIASKILALHSQLKSNQNIASKACSELLTNNPVFMDTETTGVESEDQIIEIAVVDSGENIVFESRLKPTVAITPDALEVHGISSEELINAPTWPEIAPQLWEVLADRFVVAFNSGFDREMLEQTAKAFGDDRNWFIAPRWTCAMGYAAETFPYAVNRYDSISLADAMYCAAAQWPKGQAHSAIVDAIAACRLMHAIADIHKPIQTELDNLLSRGDS